MQDSNLGVVDVMHLRLCGNEDEQGWTRLNEATNSVLPDYDDEEQTDIMDGDKGGRTANAQSSVKAFMDYYHRLENVKKNCGHAGGTLYTRAFHADRQITLDGIKDEMSDIRNMDAYMAKYKGNSQDRRVLDLFSQDRRVVVKKNQDRRVIRECKTGTHDGAWPYPPYTPIL